MTISVNPIIIPIAAFVPVILGVLWFHPSMGGRIWRSHVYPDHTTPDVHPFSVLQLLTFYLLSCIFSFALLGFVNHQMAIVQLFASQEGFGIAESVAQQEFETVLGIVQNRHLTFGHGAFHGFFGSIVFLIPVIAHWSMRERRGFRPVLLYWLFWAVSMTLMGGIVGAFGVKII